jgi:hypothetical protein
MQMHLHAARLKRCNECRACSEKWFLERKDSFTSEWITPGTAFVPDDIRRVLEVLAGLPPGASFFEQTRETRRACRGCGDLVYARIRQDRLPAKDRNPEEMSLAIKKFLRKLTRLGPDGSMRVLHGEATVGALIESLIHLQPGRPSSDSARDAGKYAKPWHDLASLPIGKRICINGLARM